MKKSLLISVLATVILLVGAVAYATADTAVVPGTGSPLAANDTVTVSASINPMLTLTVITPGVAVQTVDFGAVDPGSHHGPVDVYLTVQSNQAYGLSVAKTGDAAIGLSTTQGAAPGEPATAGANYTDAYTLDVPWTTAPGPHTATVVYTVTQN